MVNGLLAEPHGAGVYSRQPQYKVCPDQLRIPQIFVPLAYWGFFRRFVKLPSLTCIKNRMYELYRTVQNVMSVTITHDCPQYWRCVEIAWGPRRADVTCVNFECCSCRSPIELVIRNLLRLLWTDCIAIFNHLRARRVCDIYGLYEITNRCSYVQSILFHC